MDFSIGILVRAILILLLQANRRSGNPSIDLGLRERLPVSVDDATIDNAVRAMILELSHSRYIDIVSTNER